MFGLGNNRKDLDDKLPVLVQVVQNSDTFAMAQKLWQENTRAVRLEPTIRKEFLRFGLVQAGQAVWFERDQGREDSFELILSWHENGTRFADVYVVTPSNNFGTSGDAAYVNKVLDALLTTPATLPIDKQA
ncbi:MAG: hypothetical protein ACQR33_05995 [Candidatus Saccharibacteria bacterium]